MSRRLPAPAPSGEQLVSTLLGVCGIMGMQFQAPTRAEKRTLLMGPESLTGRAP